MDPQTIQLLTPGVQTLAAGLQMILAQMGGAPTSPGNIAGGLNGVPIGQNFPTTPVVAPPRTYTPYVPLASTAYTVNADGGHTEVNAFLLSKPADVMELMLEFTAAGYTVTGTGVAAAPGTIYTTDQKEYTISVKEYSLPIVVGQARFDKFQYGVDSDGNPHPGKWVLKDGAQNIWLYDNPTTIAPWSTKGLVGIL